MRLKSSVALMTALVLAPLHQAQAQVVINELMAQNSNTVNDPDYGRSADWVELYNCGTAGVDMSGYYITDNLNSPIKYQLPQGTVIAGGGYLLIWCDDNGTGLHTSFKLSADGESIGLFTPNQELVDSVNFDVQLQDVSYGRRRNAMEEWVYFSTPTPGGANGADGYVGKANQPMILTPGGLFSGSATVSITNDLGGAVHYTLDGSVPSESSAVYSSPLTFTSTTVLRARIFEDGKIPGNVVTESYFIDEAFAGHELPVVSIVTDDDNFWSRTDGIYMQDFKPDWEVPVNIEMFLNNGSDRSAFNEQAGIKINGRYAWQLPQKMLGVYFKKKYGESKLEYQLFVDDSRSSFDDFALRASGSDWSYTLMRDGLVQQAARKGGMNLDLMAFRPCVVYVNGKFLGIHNIREKVNEDYIVRHYDLKGAEFDMVEGGNTPEVGTADAWTGFFSKAKTTDLSQDANFNAFAEEFDVENFTDYIISQLYCSNTSLNHNTMVWKTVEGGQWRWILMDCDRGFLRFDKYLIDYYLDQDIWPLKRMFKNAGYKGYFCRRLADQLFTTFNADEICRQIDGHESDIAPLMDRQVARWKGTTSSYGNAIPSVAAWRNEVEALRDFARGRAMMLLDDLSNYGAQKPALLSLSSEQSDACSYTFNGHEIPLATWIGLYPQKMDITLTAKERAGYAFKGWYRTGLTDVIAKGSQWKYLDDGSDQGTAWRTSDFDDSAWKSGAAPLGYGFSDIKTTVSYGSSSKKHITTYFRRHFSVDKSADIRKVRIQLRREDGAAVYINGKCVVNSNLPVEGLDYKSLALQTMNQSGQHYMVFDISPNDIRDGDNVIAVEVHQVTASSGDLSFDLQLQLEVMESDAALISSDSTLKLQLTEDTGLCAVYESTGENVLPEFIGNDMTLYKSKSPYIVSRDVTVGSDARLTIEPGVTLLFSPGTGMTVNGAMTADGTPEDSIVFKLNPKYDASLSWGAVCFINTADRVSTISYAELRDGSRGPAEYNCVAVLSGFKTTLRLDHLRITDTDANPIACRYSDLKLTNSVLHSGITGDLVNVKYGKGYIADCEFIGNDQVDTDGIDYDGVSGGVIKRVVIHGFYGDNSDAIDLGEQAIGVCVDSVLIYDITDKGVSVGQRSTAKVTNSTFIQTNLGLGVKDSCYAEVDRCTFYAVRTPIACYEKVLGRAGGNAMVTSCVFAGSFVEDVLCDAKSTVTVNRSLSDLSDLPFGHGNIMADPQFTAPALYDLTSDSPLTVDRGTAYMPQKPDNQPVITEICYLPDRNSVWTEYLVISNVGTSDIDLSGYSFTKGISLTFPKGLVLSSGESLYVAKDMRSLGECARIEWKSGKLADEGETIELTTPWGVIIDQVSYLPTAPWPVPADGAAVIVLKDFLKSNHIASNWMLKQIEAVDGILHGDVPEAAYDLQGRPVDAKSAHGLIIIGGRKVLAE